MHWTDLRFFLCVTRFGQSWHKALDDINFVQYQKVVEASGRYKSIDKWLIGGAGVGIEGV
jgi:hypothetical protein